MIVVQDQTTSARVVVRGPKSDQSGPPDGMLARIIAHRSLPFIVGAVPLIAVIVLIVVTLAVSVLEDVNSGLASPLTLNHFTELYSDPLVISGLLNTAGFVLVTIVVSMTVGVTAAWLVERTDLPGKRLVYLLMTIGLLVPSFFMAMGWVFFLHPRIGMLNRWLIDLFSLTEAPFSISNVVGMGWVEGLALASLAFVMTSPIIRALSPALDEAATVHGLGRWKTLRYITLPLLWPALLACAIYIAIIAMATFEVPAIIGLGSNIFTFSTLVYIQVSPSLGQPNYGIVGALGAFLIVLSLLLSWWYFRVISLSHRYGVIQGRGYTPKVARLGRTKWLAWLFLGLYFCLSKILPLVMMIWAALLPFFQPFSRAALDAVSLDNFSRVDWRLVWDGFINTFILVLTVPSVALVFGLAISWVVVRSGSKASLAYDSLAFLPHAVPNLLFAVAAVIFALFFVPVSFPLYGSLFLIFAIYVVVRISLVTRVLNSAMVQIHKELEEAAAVSGLSTFDTLTRIILPLLLPAIVNLWIWNALLTYRELTMAAFLVTQDNITLPIIVWNLWTGGSSGEAAAVSLVFVVALVPLVALYWGLRSRQGIGVTQA